MTALAATIRGLAARALLRAPGRLRRALAGGPPPVIDGQALDGQLHLVLALNRRAGPPPLHTLSPARARVVAADGLGVFDVRTRPMANVRDRLAPTDGGFVLVRVYRPANAAHGGRALVYYHGGGGVIGSVVSHDPICRLLADELACVVVSVDYALAPERPFPAAVDDALAAYLWTRDRAKGASGGGWGDTGRAGFGDSDITLDIDPRRIAVAGDSMGGNLAAVTCLQAAARGVPAPALQVLIYPVIDWSFHTRSYQLFGDGFLLDRPLMEWFRDHYLPDPALADDPRASPIRTRDLAGQPRAHIVTAGFDPLRDEGRAYAEALRAAGVEVRYRCHEGLIHGFLSLAGAIAGARAAVDALLDDLRGAW